MAEMVMGKGGGTDPVKMWLYKVEIETNKDEALAVLGAVKQFGLQHKQLLTEVAFEAGQQGFGRGKKIS